ncbi:MAG TPA: hypothetical protein VFQ00_06075 [Terriglobales bacterium]|nr:hypothetical protein [Terriglobales bacterium]
MLHKSRSAGLRGSGRVLLLGFAAGSLIYAYLCVQTFRAVRFADQGNEEGFQRAALRLAPGNSDYWQQLGVVELYRKNQPELALADFHRALESNPAEADAWIQTAYALHFLNRVDESRDAISHAIAVAPARPEIRWRAANLYAQLGDQQQLRTNLSWLFAEDSTRADAALQLAWRAIGDAPSIAQLFPRQSEIYAKFARLLANSNHATDAVSVWQKMLEKTGAVADGLELVDDFLVQRDFNSAQQVWASLLEHDPRLQPYAPIAPNVLSDASFALPLLNRGLGWRRLDGQQLEINQDTSNQPAGLRIHWNAQTTVAALEQIVTVQPSRWYDFSFSARSAEFSGANGPLITLQDVPSGKVLFRSSDLREFPEWTSQQARVQTIGKFIAVRVVRDAPTPMRGTLWLRNFALKPQTISSQSIPQFPEPPR